jgi:DNA-directed RNA polymerase subunit RPC12/RpoP
MKQEKACNFGIIPPVPGMKAWYICNECGKSFRAVVLVLDIPIGIFGSKCPHCGSRRVSRDRRVRY